MDMACPVDRFDRPACQPAQAAEALREQAIQAERDGRDWITRPGRLQTG
jgi:hypothetical protein